MPDQKKDVPQLQTVHYDPILFHNDEQIYFVYKKIEAISGAVFLITHSVSDSEVIKKTLREQSIASMSRMVSLISQPRIDVSDLQTVASLVTYLHSLLDIAFWSGVASQMNVSMIQRQIGQVYKVVNNLIAKYKNNFYLDAEFFSKSDQPVGDSVHDGQANVPAATPRFQDSQKTEDTKQAPSKPKVFDKGQSKGQDVKDTSNVSYNRVQPKAPSVSNSDRRDTIISLIKERGVIGIKDVSSHIPTVSEKTIQRELLSLVEEGIIKKEGERRWSTYSLLN